MAAPDDDRGRSPLLAQCLVFFAFAMPIGVYPAGWPQERGAFGQSAAALGTLAVVYGIGRLATSASSTVLLARVSVRAVTVAVCLGLAAVEGLLGLTRAFPLLLAGIAVVGLTSGVLDSLGARYQAEIRDVRRAGLMFGSYGVGATVGPAVVAVAGWTAGFAVAAAAATAAAIAAGRPGVAWPAGMGDRPPPRAERAGTLDVRGVVLSLALAASAVALEAGTGSWMATWFEDGRGTGASAAALAVSGFWGGVTVGRLLLGRSRARAATILTRAPAAVLVGYVVVGVSPPPVAMVALVAVGAAQGVVFPTILSTTVDRVGRAGAGRVSGWQLLAANIGATSVIALVGVAVARTGDMAPIVVLGVVALVAVPLCGRAAARVPADEVAGPLALPP